MNIALAAPTPKRWAERAVLSLPVFVADHAVCELQAAVFALSLVGMYPSSSALVDRLSALAAEELRHFRKISKEARRLGEALPTKRRNFYVAALRAGCRNGGEPERGLDLLLAAALIEARSHERFEVLGPFLSDPRLKKLYAELAEAEARHGPIYLDLARAHAGDAATSARLKEMIRAEAAAITSQPWREIAVHGAV